jgi:glucose-6-phosphate 1-dehydrogenase
MTKIYDTAEMRGKMAELCAMVIFGAAGDLTKRLLLPSICNLGSNDLLPPNFTFVGFARNDYNQATFRAYIEENIKEFVTDPKALEYGLKLAQRVDYVVGNFDDSKPYEQLKMVLEKVTKENKLKPNYLFYLATPPAFFSKIVDRLGAARLVEEENTNWRRVIVEKPFGHDLDSAKLLNANITRVLAEKQIYRIDHYLGKETVQNLLAFRFANGIFEPIWNRRYIDHVQITVAESLGVEARGSYYDHAGALRDMIPNHIFQLLSYIGMEPPISMDADAIRDEKAKVLRAVREISPEAVLNCCIRGQYGPGTINGALVPGYRSEKVVTSNSATETYVAMKLMIDNWRWDGIPFYIRTGKRMTTRLTEIAIQFKKSPSIMFQKTQNAPLNPNLLVIHVQPEEGISLRFGAKIPGPIVRIGDVNMKFQYNDYFGARPGTGYETLLYDCMMGDSTLFQRDDMVISGWRVVEPILDVWSALAPRQFPNYESGSWGPKEADELMRNDGRKWRS